MFSSRAFNFNKARMGNVQYFLIVLLPESGHRNRLGDAGSRDHPGRSDGGRRSRGRRGTIARHVPIPDPTEQQHRFVVRCLPGDETRTHRG